MKTLHSILFLCVSAAFSQTVVRTYSVGPAQVSPESWGAVGDGTTDDTTAMQAAIDALPNGGVVSLSAKNYKISKITISAPITLQGTSSGGFSSISLNAWKTGTAITCSSSTENCIVVALPASNTVGGVTLAGIHIIGKPAATTGSCIHFAGGGNTTSIRNWTLKDLWIRDCKEYGIRLSGNVFEGTMLNVGIFSAGIDGLYTETNGGLPPAVISMHAVSAQLNSRHGLNLSGGGSGISCYGCYLAANGSNGVLSAGQFSNIGGYLEGNGTSSSGTLENVVVASGSYYATGVSFSGSTGISKYGIRVASGAIANIGHGNRHTGAGTADIRIDSGANSVIVQPAMTTSGTYVSDGAAAGVTQRYDLFSAGNGKWVIANGQILGWSDAHLTREGAGQIGTNGNTINAAVLTENSKRVMVQVSAPANASVACTTNQYAKDTSYLYVCVATNTWMRAPIATW